METKINIAAILKGKPKGTKLYSTIHGKCSFEAVTDEIFKINFCTSKFGLTQTGECTLIKFGNMFDNGECVIFPSKEMRDWSKFAWKKGDVLIMDGYRVVFDKWLNDDYTRFNAVHLITSMGEYIDKPLQNRYSSVPNFITRNWRKMTDAETKIYMDSLERECGGKLNLETLEIEKQPEFKDGDIVFMKGIKGGYFANCIFILKGEYKDGDERAFYYAFYNADDKFTKAEYGNTKVHYSLRLATDSEKQQLFDALAKKNKAWNAETKTLEDLLKKCKFKPFDKVLVRNTDTEEWFPGFFEKFDSTWNNPYHIMNCRSMTNFAFKQCIPYEGNKHLLNTTKNVKE